MLLLREIREAKKITQVELAKALNVNQAVISNWELGNYSPSMKNAIELARVLECSLDDLFIKPERKDS